MDVKNDSQVAAWIKKFKLLGETAFDFETCGKVKGPIKGKPKTKFNSLEEEVIIWEWRMSIKKSYRLSKKVKKLIHFKSLMRWGKNIL